MNAPFDKILSQETKELDQIEKEYDKWERNLDEAELLLFKYQDMIESLANDDISIDKLVDNLNKNYESLKKEVEDLENKYSETNKASIIKADEVLTLLRNLNSDIDNIKNSPYIKAQELISTQLNLNDVPST